MGYRSCGGDLLLMATSKRRRRRCRRAVRHVICDSSQRKKKKGLPTIGNGSIDEGVSYAINCVNYTRSCEDIRRPERIGELVNRVQSARCC